MDNRSLKQLEDELWESADLLRAESKLTSNQYCMPVLGLLFLKYAYSRFIIIEKEIQKNRPLRNGRKMPVESNDFSAKSGLFLPREAQYEYLVNLPENISSQELLNISGQKMNSLGEVVNNAMELVENESDQLKGILPKNYTDFQDNLLSELLRIFNNDALDGVGGDVIGRIYEYFLNKFAKNIASDDGVFFTPKSLVKMIVNILEPTSGTLLDPACGSGGMFVQTGDFVNNAGMQANDSMTFYGQEKVEYNAQLCLMNMSVHGLNAKIKSGNEANTFYHDVHNLDGKCDYVMANPPFNVKKVKAESTASAGRLPFGLPKENKKKEIGNGNYLWISYFYSYLNRTGRAGFVMASSATDSTGSDKNIRKKLIKTGDVDVMMSVGSNFFYTKSLPCSLWFFDKNKSKNIKDKILFIDARNYYTAEETTLNVWSEWQIKNLNAIVWLYRGDVKKYKELIDEYNNAINNRIKNLNDGCLEEICDNEFSKGVKNIDNYLLKIKEQSKKGIEKTEKIRLKIVKKEWEEKIEYVEELLQIVREANWLYGKFGEGNYNDIPGICKISSINEVEEKDWSLTPGAYVGVEPIEDDGVEFGQRINEIRKELLELQEENNELVKRISSGIEEIKYE